MTDPRTDVSDDEIRALTPEEAASLVLQARADGDEDLALQIERVLIEETEKPGA